MTHYHKLLPFLLTLALLASKSGLADNLPPAGTADPEPRLIYSDNFEDGDYTNPAGENGLTWEVVRGRATVENVSDSLRLGIYRGDNLILAKEVISENNFTIAFDARVTWTVQSHFVFLYRTPDDYYYLVLSGDNAGVYRVMNGVQTFLYQDKNSWLTIPHSNNNPVSFKIHINNDGNSIRLSFDRGGDFRDYDVEIVDDDPAAAAGFRNTRIGAANNTEPHDDCWFHLDNVAVYGGYLKDSRKPVTLYVDGSTGNDERTYAEAQSPRTPWRSIQRAADDAGSGDTVLVAAGIYHEIVTPQYSGKASSPITFRAADPAHRPIVSGTTLIGNGWTAASITTFDGKTVKAFRHVYDEALVALFQSGKRMFEATEPDMSDPDDPFDIARFRPVPAEHNPGTSRTELIDPDFFVQAQPDYWKGARLLIYDGFGNAVGERPIVAYDPAAHKVTVSPAFNLLIGPDRNSPDSYAVRGHVGVLDMPGEFALDPSTEPPSVVVLPYPDSTPETVASSTRNHGFSIQRGSSGIVIDGFEICQQKSDGIKVLANSSDILIANCYVHDVVGSGFSSRDCANITVSNCFFTTALGDGVNFGGGSNYAVLDCEITENGDNGIWVGTGGGTRFNTVGVTIRGNHIHYQGGRRRHPDNYQMHQCDNVLIENNIMEQDGQQNGWCQYTGNLIFRNNIIKGGPFGFNSVVNSEISHNAFIDSGLRFDAHLTNHPEYGSYYLPRDTVIRNNVIIDSSISWPPATVLNRHKVFTVDHNYYNIGNSYVYQGWDWQGYQVGVGRQGSIFVSDQKVAAAGQTVSCDAQVVWSNPSRLLVLYRDPDNYYAIGLASGTRGIFRRINGVETRLYEDSTQKLHLPHGGYVGSYTIGATNDGKRISLQIRRDSTGLDDSGVSITDDDPAAVATFTGQTAFGMMTMPVGDSNNYASYIRNVSLQDAGNTWKDSFGDGDFTTSEGEQGMTWTVVNGTAVARTIESSRGVGFGAGSIVTRNRGEAADQFIQPPSSEPHTPYNLRLLPESTLRNAGTSVGLTFDLDNQPRPVGEAADIGPYQSPADPP